MKYRLLSVIKLAVVGAIVVQLSACALSDKKSRVVTNVLDEHIRPDSSWSRGALAVPATLLGNGTLLIDGAVINPLRTFPSAFAYTFVQEYCLAESITETGADIYIYFGSLIFWPPLFVSNWTSRIMMPKEGTTKPMESDYHDDLYKLFFQTLPHDSPWRVALSPILVVSVVSYLVLDSLIVSPATYINNAAHAPQKLWTDLNWHEQFVYSCATVPWRAVITPVLYTIHVCQPSTYRAKVESTTRPEASASETPTK